MVLQELIERAKESAGSYGQLADLLGCHQNRITDWKKGTRQPDASKIARMAEVANLPILQTVAEIECQIDEEHATTWRAALGKLTAAGVTASAILIFGTLGAPEKANADNGLARGQYNAAQWSLKALK